MAEVLNAVNREQLGSSESRRLRKSGKIPAVLYGHGEENVNLTLPASEVHAAIRHGSRVVDIAGAVTQSALISDVQWDAFGVEILHLDLTRVDAGEAVEITIAVDLRGEAPGTKEGGAIEHMLHQVEIRCPAGAIPEKLEASINDLHLGGTITAGELPLPEGATLISDEKAVIVQCVEPSAEVDEEVATAEPGEPEVIGAKPDEDEED